MQGSKNGFFCEIATVILKFKIFYGANIILHKLCN